jgi:hypothetical protein
VALTLDETIIKDLEMVEIGTLKKFIASLVIISNLSSIAVSRIFRLNTAQSLSASFGSIGAVCINNLINNQAIQ